MNKKMIAFLIGTTLTISLAGCGTAQSNNPSQNKNSNQSGQTSKTGQDNSMKGMKMGNQALSTAFQDELNGFTKIEQDVSKGNYTSANTLAGNLHDEFHAAILPPLADKKGKTYAEDIHGKYDALQDAISSKDNAKITEMINVNRDNLHTIAPILGVPLK